MYLDTIETMYLRRKERGFTLIELLVVIAIIGLLSSVVLASLSSARERARDARRSGDLKQLQIAFELYYDSNAQYPCDPSNTRVERMNTGCSNITPYISPIPKDPTNTGSNGYRYRISNVNGRESYTLLVKLDKNEGSWCSLSVSPGHTQWINSYPPCDF